MNETKVAAVVEWDTSYNHGYKVGIAHDIDIEFHMEQLTEAGFLTILCSDLNNVDAIVDMKKV